MIGLVKSICIRINNCNNYSTNYNINYYNKLLNKYYKKKINKCNLCHKDNKCSIINMYNFNDKYYFKKLKEFNCLK